MSECGYIMGRGAAESEIRLPETCTGVTFALRE